MASRHLDPSCNHWDGDSGYGSDGVLSDFTFGPDTPPTELEDLFSPTAFAALVDYIKTEVTEQPVQHSPDAILTSPTWVSPDTDSLGRPSCLSEQQPHCLLLQGEYVSQPAEKKRGLVLACKTSCITKAKKSGSKRGRPRGSKDTKPRKRRGSCKSTKTTTTTSRLPTSTPKPTELPSQKTWTDTPSPQLPTANGSHTSSPRTEETHSLLDGMAFQLESLSTDKTYYSHTSMIASPQVPYELPDEYDLVCISCNDWANQKGDIYLSCSNASQLPSCGHTACQSCLTECYSIGRNTDFCLACPVCGTFAGFLQPSPPLEPYLIPVMSSKACALPSG